jgi:hypothetical protein
MKMHLRRSREHSGAAVILLDERSSGANHLRWRAQCDGTKLIPAQPEIGFVPANVASQPEAPAAPPEAAPESAPTPQKRAPWDKRALHR